MRNRTVLSDRKRPFLQKLQMTASEYKTIRQQLGTQAEVARSLGVARSTVAHRESGRMVITPEAALAISALTRPKKQRVTHRPNAQDEKSPPNKTP